MKRAKKIRWIWAAMAAAVLFAVLAPVRSMQAAEKKKYENWQGVAQDMHLVFQEAIAHIDAKNDQAAYDAVNSAYFDYYEVQGFEKNVMYAISKERVSHIEAMFRDIKHSLLGNKESEAETVKSSINLLDMKVCRDALILDGVEPLDAPDEAGLAILKTGETKTVDAGTIRINSFVTSFGLLLREGLEAILVCVAIIAYLIKTGNKHLCKGVYLGMLAGLAGSVVLAVLIHFIFGGVGQELLEGWTMFLAVIVLFWVSNWMLSRSEEAAWEAYIHKQVERSIDRRSLYGLIGAAFLAVIREGAELILFYKAILSGGMTDHTYGILGFAAAAAVLVAVYCIFRFTSVRLPLKPFFMATSILLYILCISFMGKGVVELSEAGLISGGTTIPAMRGFSFELLGIYDRAETLIPQIMLLIASLWILISHSVRNKRKMREIKTDHAAAGESNA